MKIVFDITAPKQVTFFKPIIDRLKKIGASVYLTTREYNELNILLENFNLKPKVIGRHGGSSLYGKLTNSAERVLTIAKYFNRIKPDALVTLSNPESSRAAFGLNIPIICFNDVPESKFVSKLTLPLADIVFAPWLIPKKDFVSYGVNPEKIFYYHALDPVIWLERATPDPYYYKKLGLTGSKSIVVCRETEWQSSYENHDIVASLMKELHFKHPEWQFLDIPRYRKHKYYDSSSLLSRADLFIGGGGTMCIEAAYYGTPVIATRLFECHYMKWMFDKKLAIKPKDINHAVDLAEDIILNKKRNNERAKKSFSKMHFHVDKICNQIIKISLNS